MDQANRTAAAIAVLMAPRPVVAYTQPLTLEIQQLYPPTVTRHKQFLRIFRVLNELIQAIFPYILNVI
jgi:hypothetical protein